MFDDLSKDSEVAVPSPPLHANAAFVHKCLHPPSAIPNFVGLPTMDTRTQTVLNYTIPKLMDPPTYSMGTFNKVQALEIPKQTAFKVGILTLTGARVLSIAFCYNTIDGAWYQDLSNTIINDVYDFSRFASDATLYRPCYKSMTTHLNATAFNNIGMVTGSQFNPNILFQGVPFQFLQSNFNAGMAFIKHLFKTGVANVVDCDELLIDGEREYTDLCSTLPRYLANEIRQEFKLKNSQSLAIPANYNVQILMMNPAVTGVEWNGTFPFPTASQIMQQSARSYNGKALEGTFTVSRLNTVSPSWKPAANTIDPGDANVYLPYCFYAMFNTAGGWTFGNWWEPTTTIGSFVKPLRDTYWTQDMTCSWTLYDGLTFNSANNNLQTTTQLLIYKHCFGMEVQPSLKSAWAGTVVLAPKPDIMAMQRLLDAFYEVKDCLPARYNFWGMLGSLAKEWLPKIGGGLLSHVFKVNTENDGKLFKDIGGLVKPFKKMIATEKQKQVTHAERSATKTAEKALKTIEKAEKTGKPPSEKTKARMQKAISKADANIAKQRKLYGTKKRVPPAKKKK